MTDVKDPSPAVLRDEMQEADDSTKALLDEMQLKTEERDRQQISLTDAANKNDPEKDQGEKDGANAKLSADLSADILIGAVDFLLTQGLTKAHDYKLKKRMRRRFGDDAMEKAEALLDRMEAEKNIIAEKTPDEVGMLRLMKKYREVTGDIPLKEEEKEKIRPSLVAYLKEQGGELPPWMGLALMVTETIGSRVMDAIVE